MKIVSILAADDEAEIVDAHLAFHLNIGVDFVLAKDDGAPEDTAAVLDSYARAGRLERESTGRVQGASWRTDLVRRAVMDHGADWVVSSDADEFWWPRGEGLKDVLAVIPERYDVVQALVREFRPRPEDGRSFSERLTVRPSLDARGEQASDPVEWALRSVYRASPSLAIEPGDRRGVPLRAWYPVEVLRFPFRSSGQVEGRYVGRVGRSSESRSRVEAELLAANDLRGLRERYAALVIGDEGLKLALEDGTLAEDVRLRDALRELRDGASEDGRLVLKTPDIVDDASYAVECAAVGEVDLAGLDRQLRELEDRIVLLEARFWPRVARTLSRVVRR